MGKMELKKKPKPFKAMSKGLCTGVQSRRIMVVVSLTLVIIGCLALYSAMQNEEWTKDEPSERKVFFLAFLLLISSIVLCYYALNGDLEEDKEKESERLTSIQYSGYSSIKSDTLIRQSQPAVDKNIQNGYLALLQPQKKVCSKHAGSVGGQCLQSNYVQRGSYDVNRSYDVEKQVETRPKSLIVQLMPNLPLELCERELKNINFPGGVPLNREPLNSVGVQIRPELKQEFPPVHKNADAG